MERPGRRAGDRAFHARRDLPGDLLVPGSGTRARDRGILGARSPRIGVKHFALTVHSAHEAKNFVENRGIASNVVVQQGRTGVTYFFIKDPSGILVEFLEDKRGF
ncbi:MAG: VOC family protein [Pseudonocardiaceae bacterium]